MRAKSADEIVGIEFDWLASDADGHVALFSTAGGGHVPDEFLEDTEAHDAAIDTILASPASTEARFAPEVAPGLENTWRKVAERGLFAFDSDAHGGPYRLVAASAVPTSIAELPGDAASVAGRLAFQHLRFSGLECVTSEMVRPR